MTSLNIGFLFVLLTSAFLATDSSLATIALPVIPNRTFDVSSYGAVADGSTDNAAAIQNAINAASAAGGGAVIIPGPGVYLSGPVTLGNNLNLQIASGAILRALPLASYPGGTSSPPDLINGNGRHDVEISGAGIIDGQGEPWWRALESNSSIKRPLLASFQPASRVLVQDITFSNAPAQNLVIKGRGGDVTIQGVTFRAPSSHDPVNKSHNTDAIDLAETNCVIQNCDISVGDDNVALGSSGGLSADILVTNCACGDGHGISIGSHTSSGVSNITVVDCTFTNTDQGIRIKSDRDRGGLVRNLSYRDLTMSNVQYPILIYASYNSQDPAYRALNNLTPQITASYPAASITSKTPIYRDITISNVTATAQSGRMAGLIWGLPEMAVSNLVLDHVTINGSKTFGIYDAKGIQILNSRITTPAGVSDVSFYNAEITFSNSAVGAPPFSLDGASTNGVGNTLRFYNVNATLTDTNALANSPGLTLDSSTLSVANNLDLSSVSDVNFALGIHDTRLAVTGRLNPNTTVNVSAGAGFTNREYNVFTYGSGALGSLPVLGSAPAGHEYSFETNTTGEVKLLVEPPAPSASPVSLNAEFQADQLAVSWPKDHQGWRLQIQTNESDAGLTTNWTDITGSQQTNEFSMPIDPELRSAFLRLVYP